MTIHPTMPHLDDGGAVDRPIFALVDAKHKIYPWGFVDPGREKKFREYHWLTWINNYRNIMLKFSIFNGSVNVLAAAKTIVDGAETWDIIRSLLRVCFPVVMYCLFSGRLSSGAKNAIYCVIGVYLTFISTPMVVMEFCRADYRPVFVASAMCVVGGGLTLVFPNWKGTTAYQIVVYGAIPIPYNLLVHLTHENRSEILFRVWLFSGGIAVNLLLSSWWNVRRRQNWILAQRRKRRRSNASPSSSPSPRGSRSSSQARPRSRSRSASPSLPKISEGVDGWKLFGREALSGLNAPAPAPSSALAAAAVTVGGPQPEGPPRQKLT